MIYTQTDLLAALYVDGAGIYASDPSVDPWPESRDARTYRGPHPVIAHPPCARWCQLARLVEARYGYRVGDDGGCFAAALAAVRRWGGLLEHPAYSLAWPAHDLPRPLSRGGWTDPDSYGGRACHVEQAQYGHPARKATWLYAIVPAYPEMRWGRVARPKAWVSSCDHVRYPDVPRLGRRAASATPPEFHAALLALVRG